MWAMTTITDGTATNGEVTLATRDYGGSGPDLLFIPGAGQTLVDCGVLAPHLVAHHRVVAMDLRSHGHSSEGTFTFEAALDDVEAVIAALGLERPAIVGHSLGGMIAAMHGARHPDALGVVNVDGHGSGRAYQYDGVSQELFDERAQVVKALLDEQLTAMRDNPEVMPEAALEAMVTQYQALFGLDEALLREVAERSLVPVEGGFMRRVSVDTNVQILEQVGSLDLPAVYRACEAPLLVYNAVNDAQLMPGRGPEWMAEHAAAYRRGLSRELAALADELPHMSYIEIDATHALHYEQPELIAQQLVEFLAR
jgi:pimeloyl-ACP methyl ester carboxylesterase